MKPLRTSDIAKAYGIHPNTVRKYEEQGFLPKPLRGPNGYRLFTQRHSDQVGLVILLFRCTWLGESFKQRALETITRSAEGDLAAAQKSAAALLALVQEERTRAEQATELLAAWASNLAPGVQGTDRMTIKEAAAYLNVTAHTLRNWDRNGLLKVPRHTVSGYRTYGTAELQRLMVIRALRRAKFNLMSILHMFRQFDADRGIDPLAALDSLPPGEPDIVNSTYRWLTKLREIEGYAREAVERLEAMP